MSFLRAKPRSGKAVLSLLLLALAGCGGGGGGGGSTPPPSGNPDPNPPVLSRLTLTGTVTDAPIANAVVTATVNGQTFTANADANGNYSLPISVAENATSSFVTLSARGVGSQAHVEFTSLLGTFASLKTQAGSDDTLSSTENFATQITNVSTAMAVLLQQANGGQPVTSATLLQSLAASLDGQEMLAVATAIKLLVDEADHYPMPAGYTSLRTLLADTDAFEEFVAAALLQDPTMFEETRTAIVNDASLTRPVTTASLPATLTAALMPNDVESIYTSEDRVVRYQFDADGTGTASSGTWHTDLTWSISGSSIVLTYDSPVPIWGRERWICPELAFHYSPANLPVDYTLRGATLTLLNDRVLAVTEDRRIDFRYCGPDGVIETVTIARTLIDEQNTQQIAATELSGSARVLWVFDEFSLNNDDRHIIMPDLAQLRADGTGSTHMFNKQFNWQLDTGGRVITATFEDGTVARYRSLRDLDDAATDVLYDFTLPSGARRVGVGVSVHEDAQRPLVFSPENVVGRYYYAGRGSKFAPPGLPGYRLRFDADGTGSHEEDVLVDEQGTVETWDVTQRIHWGIYWQIEGDDLLVQHTRTNDDLYNCVPGTALCNVIDERRYVPLLRNGNRAYWLEYNRASANGVNDFSSRRTFITFYDYEPLGATALTAKAPRTSKLPAVITPQFRRPTSLLPSQR